ncbi:hypothetical protein BKA80DRAFT_8320 [Phyllosticta citrichinensis]
MIASGDSVIKSAKARDSIAQELKVENDVDCLCFEMEAAGLDDFPCLVVRGISDYADSHKNDRWQRYAAMTAAAFVKELLQNIGAKEVETIETVREVVNGLDQYVRKAGEELVDSKRMGEIKTWLNAPDPSINSVRALSLRHPDTGTWLLQSPAFQTFKSSTNRQFIWLHGLSGCGKTCLAASVVQDLGEAQKASGAGAEKVVLNFFFDFRDPKKQSLDGLVRSLIEQLFFGSSDGRVKTIIHQLFLDCKYGTTQPSTEDLEKTFDCAIATLGEIQLVLDALDECPQGSKSRRPVLEWIARLLRDRKNQKTLWKLFVTSRSGQPDIEDRFNALQITKNYLSVDARDDIYKFVEGKLEEYGFQRWHASPDIRENIRSTVTEKAGNMFRLAELQMSQLEQCGSAFAFEEALKILPNDLNEFYERSLLQVPVYYHQGVFQLLQLLLYSKISIFATTALDFMAIDLNAKNTEDAFNERKVLKDFGPISPILSSLITIDDSFDVTIAHASVKDFLVSSSKNILFATDFSERSAKSSILKALLSYIASVSPELARNPNYTDVHEATYDFGYTSLDDFIYELRNIEDDDVDKATQEYMTQFFLDHRLPSLVLMRGLDDSV